MSEKSVAGISEEKPVDEKIKDKLEGHVLVLDPKRSGMYVDSVNKINLHFFSDGNDRFTFLKGMDPTVVLKNIKAGILRVLKDTVDVTDKFGGTKEALDWQRIPIVEDHTTVVKTDKDKHLLNLLGRNNEKEIIRDIQSIKDFKLLERLEELEKRGSNPTAISRAAVLDAIVAAIKKVPGVGEAKELPQDKKDVISAK